MFRRLFPLYPSSLLLRGSEAKATFAHGIAVEVLTFCDAFQTTDANAQKVEKRIQRVWTELQDRAGDDFDQATVDAQMREITTSIAQLPGVYEDWQILGFGLGSPGGSMASTLDTPRRRSSRWLRRRMTLRWLRRWRSC